MGVLFTPPKNVEHFYLKVDDIHTLYVEHCGNRTSGIPMVFLHGGPGWPIIGRAYAVYTNPRHYWCITFHQRGAGLSKPLGCIKKNKTADQIRDIEAIRKKLNIDKWVVVGGSWGATLSVLYASKHPSSVLGLVIFGLGIFNRNHLMEESTKIMAPDVYDAWKLHDSEKKTFQTYFRKLQSPSVATRDAYAKKWSYEEKLFDFMNFPTVSVPAGLATPKEQKDAKKRSWIRAMALLECYYYMNQAFTTPKKLLGGAKRNLRRIPGYIIHGRFDLICSPENSYLLHQVWPKSVLCITDQAGHGMFDETTAKAIRKAFHELHKQLRGRRRKVKKSSKSSKKLT